MPKRILTGTVVSSKTNKTIVVKVTRRVQHKLYKKLLVNLKNIMRMMKITLLKLGILLKLLNLNLFQN